MAVSSPTKPIPDALRTRIRLLLPILRTAGPVGPVRSAILAGMLTDASLACGPIQRGVVESLKRPSRRSMTLAVRSFILNRVDVTAELADLTVPSLFVASDDRGDWTPEDARAASALAADAQAVTIAAARTLIPLEQPEALALHVRQLLGPAGLTMVIASRGGPIGLTTPAAPAGTKGAQDRPGLPSIVRLRTA